MKKINRAVAWRRLTSGNRGRRRGRRRATAWVAEGDGDRGGPGAEGGDGDVRGDGSGARGGCRWRRRRGAEDDDDGRWRGLGGTGDGDDDGAAWRRRSSSRRRRAGGHWRWKSENFQSATYIAKALVPVGGSNRNQYPPFGPGWCHQPGLKASFHQRKGREAEGFGPGWWHQPGPKGSIGSGWSHQPGLMCWRGAVGSLVPPR